MNELAERQDQNLETIDLTSDEGHLFHEEQDSQEDLSETTNFQRIKKIAHRGLTISSILIDPLYCYFLFVAVRAITEDLQEKFELESDFWDIFITTLISFFVFSNFICDITQVNPIEEAEVLTNREDYSFKEQIDQLENAMTKRSVKLFSYFNLTVANSVFFADAAAGAISVAYLTELKGLQWSVGLPVILVNIIYYNMLMRGTLNSHSYEFMRRLLDLRHSMVVNAIKSPAKSLEVIIQVLAGAAFKGVASSYVVNELLTQFFNIDQDSEIRRDLVIYAMCSASWMIMFAKTLSVHKKYFDQQFDDLDPELLKHAKAPKLKLMFDAFIISLRAASAGTLLYRHGPENFTIKALLTGALSSLIMSHGLYVRYKSRLNQAALDIKLTGSSSEVILVDNLASMSAERIFSIIQEKFKTKNLKRIVVCINSGAIALVWISFLSFLNTLNALVKENTNINLDFYDLLCLQQLWGVTSLENDAAFFQGLIFENLSYYRTKVFLENKRSHFGLVHSFFKSKSDYPRAYLEKFVTSNLLESEQNLLPSRTPFSLPINQNMDRETIEDKSQEESTGNETIGRQNTAM